MALKYEGKRLRQVKEYTRKSSRGRTVYVSTYMQRYDKPRGARNPTLGIDAVKDKSRTAWLKDSAGRFVGRANVRGKTKARRYAMAGLDVTMNVREKGKYGRLYGRAPQKVSRRR